MKQLEGISSLFKGLGSPIVGLAFLNSILFASYGGIILYIAGFGAGIACFLVSTPTELVKCRAQIAITTNYLRQPFQYGLYKGGLVTIIRDAPGYGVYFWAYEGLKRVLEVTSSDSNSDRNNVLKLLFAGGTAGLLSWASIYPLDVIKTRLQTQQQNYYSGIIDCAIKSYREEGAKVFFKGMSTTLVRAWPVNAVTFFAYELVIGCKCHYDILKGLGLADVLLPRQSQPNDGTGNSLDSFVSANSVRSTWIAFWVLWIVWALLLLVDWITKRPTHTDVHKDTTTTADGDTTTNINRGDHNRQGRGGFLGRLNKGPRRASRIARDLLLGLLAALVMNTLGRGSGLAVEILAWIFVCFAIIWVGIELIVDNVILRVIFGPVQLAILLTIFILSYALGWRNVGY
ncbi:6082_t:CDS:10 [Entrophospora sp. SA101]|nr:6082_t:CDS:10 [Entrophospora sp. SA101]